MLHHCPHKPCGFFSPNIFSRQYHLQQCAFRPPSNLSLQYTSTPCGFPLFTERPKRENSSETIGTPALKLAPRIRFSPTEKTHPQATRHIVTQRTLFSDGETKKPSESGTSPSLSHSTTPLQELVMVKLNDLKLKSIRMPERKTSCPGRGLLLCKDKTRNGIMNAEQEKLNVSKKSAEENDSASKKQNDYHDSEHIPFSYFALQPCGVRPSKNTLQDMHVDYLTVCLASIANSMGEKVADEIIQAVKHPNFSLEKFKNGVVSAGLCKERSVSIAKRYVGFAMRGEVRNEYPKTRRVKCLSKLSRNLNERACFKKCT